MPERDGLETMRDIWNIDPNAKVIAPSCCAMTKVDFLKVAETFGALTSVKKPFRRSDHLPASPRLSGVVKMPSDDQLRRDSAAYMTTDSLSVTRTPHSRSHGVRPRRTAKQR